jgi:hypothetical protein
MSRQANIEDQAAWIIDSLAFHEIRRRWKHFASQVDGLQESFNALPHIVVVVDNKHHRLLSGARLHDQHPTFSLGRLIRITRPYGSHRSPALALATILVNGRMTS